MSTQQRIFISYRRDDTQFAASALNDGLRNRLREADVFMDLDSIPPGADFEEHIRSYIDDCDVVLVVIGDQWLDPEPGKTTRRIDNPNDFVRLEILSALRAPKVKVIPVLVEGAKMPSASDLPDDIAGLSRRNAFTVSDSHLGRDITELTNHLRGGRPETQAQSSAESTVTLGDLDLDAVKYAIASLPSQFATKDVSEHPVVLATHEGLAGRSSYHTMLGRFLTLHRGELGLGSPEAPQNDRGARWTKVGAVASPPAATPTPAFVQAPRQVGAPQPPQPTPNAPAATTDGDTSSAGSGRWMIALPIISFGLLAFVPALRAAGRIKHDPARRRRLYIIAGALALAAALAIILFGVSPTDAEGTATGPLSTIGALLMFAAMAVGVFVAVTNRTPPTVLAGTAQELARRDLRQQYRQLVGRDPALAASMQVGRPDLARQYDDGGLVDINSIPAEALQQYAGLSSAEAEEVLRARGQLGRLSGLTELEAFSSLPQGAIARLREIAVFV